MKPFVRTGQKGMSHFGLFFCSLTVFTENPLLNHPSIQGRPPQINWASRPIPRTDTPCPAWASSSQQGDSPNEAAGRQLIAVYVEANRLAELEEVLSQLEIPLLLAPCPNHENGELPPMAPQNNEEQNDCDHSTELDQLTASLSSLSTSNDLDLNPSDLFPARCITQKSSMVSPGKKRYYTITVGKCTGVYWDT